MVWDSLPPEPHNESLLLVYSRLLEVGMTNMGLERPPGHLRKGTPLGPGLRPGSPGRHPPHLCQRLWLVTLSSGGRFVLAYTVLAWLPNGTLSPVVPSTSCGCASHLCSHNGVFISHLTLQHPQEVRPPWGTIFHSVLLVLCEI